MNTHEAKAILTLYRPGTPDADDPAVVAALTAVAGNPALRHWFDQHCAFQQAMRRKFREIPVPAGLPTLLLAEPRVLRPTFWQRPPAWLAAAAAVVLVGVAVVFWPARVPDRFTDFRSRMVRVALREYRMDVRTHDMAQVRQFLQQHGAPADYRVPAGLARLPLTGGGLLRWRNHPVSMVCFNRGDDEMLFLFVMDQAAAKDMPATEPAVDKVNKLLTVSWSAGGRTYVLAGPAEPGFAEKYL